MEQYTTEEAVLSAIQNEADSLSKTERQLIEDERYGLMIQRTYQNAGVYSEMFGVNEAEFRAMVQQHTGLVEVSNKEQSAMTIEQVTRICGHSEPVPPFMGRGQARVKRIAQFASYKCDACHNAELVAFAARLTRIDGSHYTPAEQAAYVAKHARKE